MLTIVTYCWGEKYGRHYVRRLAKGVKRWLMQTHRFAVVTDSPGQFADMGISVFTIPEEDRYLLNLPGCMVRMRLFDPEWQRLHGIDDRLVCIDLDAVITGPLDAVFDRLDDFAILQHVNTTNPCPFNGSVFMLRAGSNPQVWADFSLDAAASVPFHAFPDDQGWMHAKITNPSAWTGEDGVYAFKKRGWPSGDNLPAGAAIVAFPGWRDPSKVEHLKWVKENWHDRPHQ